MRFLSCILALSILWASCQKDAIRDADFYACQVTYPDSSTQNPRHAIYQNLLNTITSEGAPGVSMYIQTPQHGAWVGTAGLADLAAQIPLRPCNRTRVGSTVKMFTAVAILQLAEEGKLRLDDRAADYLSPEQIAHLANADQATIRQLLQHSSGIYNYIQNLHFQTASLNDLIRVWHPEDLMRYARHQNPAFALGADVQYSNTNYILLGWIIERVEGRKFYEVFRDKIFIPLGLQQTAFAAADPVPSDVIRGYVDFYSNLQVIEATYYSGWDYYTADGGLISTPRDLSRFLQGIMDSSLISGDSRRAMFQWRSPQQPDPSFFPIQYGLGIFKMETPYGDAYFHSGDAIGYYANALYVPSRNTYIAWAVNGNYGKIDEATLTKSAIERILATVLG